MKINLYCNSAQYFLLYTAIYSQSLDNSSFNDAIDNFYRIYSLQRHLLLFPQRLSKCPCILDQTLNNLVLVFHYHKS